MKTLNDFNFKGKRVLLRADLNSNVVDGKVLMSERIRRSVRSVKELKRKGARVVVIAHQGQPGKSGFLSLKKHAKLLRKFVKVRFVDEVVGERALKEIGKLKNGEVLLLENVRFEKDEFNVGKGKKNELYKLVDLFDIYVNDAFSVCHREHFSIVGFPKYLKSCAGRLLEEEIKVLKKINIKECLHVLGGAKPRDYLVLLKGNKVLACGLFGQSCLVARGKDLGAQNKYLRKEADVDEKFLRKLKLKLKNVETPVDFAVRVKGSRRELKLDEFPSKFEIFDIGSETIEKYVEEIKKAKFIYMKGPVGYFSYRSFDKGTNALLRAVAESRAFSLIGGGHLSDAVFESGINRKKFGHVSLSGGALLKYIGGGRLVGLERL